MALDLEQVSRGLRIAFPSILWCLSSTPFLAFLCLFSPKVTLQYQRVDVVTSDHVTKVGNFSFLYCWNYVKLFDFSSLQDIFIIFRYAQISNDCNFVIFLVVIVHVSHPYKSVDHTYAFIIRFLVFILMCLAVIVFNITFNAPLAISIIFKISSSHFPFDVIDCPKYIIFIVV